MKFKFCFHLLNEIAAVSKKFNVLLSATEYAFNNYIFRYVVLKNTIEIYY